MVADEVSLSVCCVFFLTLWLIHRKAAGEAMPDNEASFARMQENDIRLKQIAQKQ